MGNVLIALNALASILSQAQGLQQLLATANSEGRDLTPDELAQVQSTYTAAHSKLDADIAAASAPKVGG